MAKRKRRLKSIFRRMRRPAKRYLAVAVVAVLLLGGLLIERNAMHINYTQLLDTIAQGESKGNYNAYFGNSQNQAIVFTDMSVSEVLAWQQRFVEQGNASSAVGKYQFINTTLAGLVRELNISHDTLFDAALQDRLAIRLLERRGVHDYMRGRISREQLAHNLSKEWAALPRVIGDRPNESYYASDGLNKSHVGVEQVLAAIDTLHDDKT